MGEESLLQLLYDYQTYWGRKAFFGKKLSKIITILLSRCIKTMKGEDTPHHTHTHIPSLSKNINRMMIVAPKQLAEENI